jgi:glutamyl-tRNA synthetase
MSPRVIGRLAPSPTGAQHVGNARTYLMAWLAARSVSGRIILRLEDIDSPRVKPQAIPQALQDLAWLGLDWDEGPDLGGPHAPYLQSLRIHDYERFLKILIDRDGVYPCTCSRSDIAMASSAPHQEQEGQIFRYPETCRSRSTSDARHLVAGSYAWRFRSTNTPRTVLDKVAGRVRCSVRNDLGDFIVFKADGSPSYQLAVVIDDAAMGINQVVRGDDLLPSTFRQIELAETFGFNLPEYAHVPLVVGEDGRRLAKRHGDTRLSSLREQGVLPEKLVGFLAWSIGLLPQPTNCHPRELIGCFTWDKIARKPFTFRPDMI